MSEMDDTLRHAAVIKAALTKENPDG